MTGVQEKILKTREYLEYLDYFERYYNNAQKAWKVIQEKCGNDFRFMYDDYIWNCINEDVTNHDMSKLSENEFIQYRQFFYPCSFEVKDKDMFMSAWEHHKKNNVHHWQNWTKTIGTIYDDMLFVVMMVVDWVAMSYEMGDTAKEYYENNREVIKLENWADSLVKQIFNKIY